MSADETLLLTVQLDGALPLRLDYGENSAELLTLAHVDIANREFKVLRVEDKGQRFIAEILPGLPAGLQDVKVTLQDGRQVVLEQSFEVKPPLDITEVRIDPIATQIRQRPFNITIRMIGPDAELFRGRVKLAVTRGVITPQVSSPFGRGVHIQEVTVDDTSGLPVAIIVEDYVGRSATSNDFRLLPSP
jgi:hypothetical protein